jgi:mannose-6-phosphate isomerase
MSPQPTRLAPYFREMIWGVTSLGPWFPNSEKRIGEVWFWPEDRSILAKFIFTSDRLSIQVHPSDAQAARLEGSHGKSEMWHILRAEPGARIALGPRQPVSRERLREAARSGEIEQLLEWIEVQAGETYFIHPGTIHTIGPGVTLCEIQQYSDLTYRLYDYGRPRPLHLEKAVEVANLEPHPGRSTPVWLGEGRRLLGSCPYFSVERWDLTSAIHHLAEGERGQVLMVLEGRGSLGREPFKAGEVWLIPAGEPLVVQGDGPACVLRTWAPRLPAC